MKIAVIIVAGAVAFWMYLRLSKSEKAKAAKHTARTPQTVVHHKRVTCLEILLLALMLIIIVAVGWGMSDNNRAVQEPQPEEYVEPVIEITSSPAVPPELVDMEYQPPVVRLPIDIQALHWAIGQVEGGPIIGPHGERGRCQAPAARILSHSFRRHAAVRHRVFDGRLFFRVA